jgi:hypothetical protein
VPTTIWRKWRNKCKICCLYKLTRKSKCHFLFCHYLIQAFMDFRGGEKRPYLPTFKTLRSSLKLSCICLTYCPFSAVVSPSNSSINISVFFWSVTHKRQSSRHMWGKIGTVPGYLFRSFSTALLQKYCSSSQ